jgi:hypothetical protein
MLIMETPNSPTFDVIPRAKSHEMPTFQTHPTFLSCLVYNWLYGSLSFYSDTDLGIGQMVFMVPVSHRR